VFYNKINEIHRMSSILSDISEKINVDGMKKSISDVVNTIRSKIGLGEQSSDENVNDVADAASVATAANPVIGVAQVATTRAVGRERVKEILWGIVYKIRDYIVEYGPMILKAIIYIMMASCVANDMIIYPAVIRGIFFAATLFVTSSNMFYAIMIGLYYGSKYGWDYYNERLSTDKIKPPKSFPTIFAVCPLTTTYYDSTVKRFFLWPFIYQNANNTKERKSENNKLIELMKGYWNDLNNSFDYLNKIKEEPHIAELYKRNKENITAEKMHPLLRPLSTVDFSADDITPDDNKIQMVAAATAVAAKILGKTATVIPSMPVVDATSDKSDKSEAA
jgi:hypothetical protein